jgi:hypothetical protein
VSIGVTFVRDEDGVTLDRVLIRDTKREAAPTITVSAGQWREFLALAVAWNRDDPVRYGGGIRLLNTHGIGTDWPVCLSTDSTLMHLHFGWDEWNEFVDLALASALGRP